MKKPLGARKFTERIDTPEWVEEAPMPDLIRTAQYFKVQVADKPGEVARMLGTLHKANVNLLALYAFPRNRRTQVDIVPEDPTAFKNVAKQARWSVQGPKTCFLLEGDDRPGALVDVTTRLGAAKINITAVSGRSAGQGRFGAMLWVKPRDTNKAAKVLGIA
jgi:hypothetical protein